MILVRSPLRITLGGGGTDLPDYASEFGGFCLTAAITQYVYVSVIRPFEPGVYLKYSELERVPTLGDIKHPIIRETLSYLNVMPQIELTTLADIPSGTGLGSSSSFTTALVKAVTLHETHGDVSAEALAKLACQVEMDRLKAPIGPQDQYAAAFGGLLALSIHPNGSVHPQRVTLAPAVRQEFEDRLLLFFTGYTRDANRVIRSSSNEALHEIKALGHQACRALHAGDWHGFGELLHTHWHAKQRRSGAMSNPKINGWYDLARQHGAIGGKLVGAGGGGCLLFLAKDPQHLRAGLKDSGLQEIRFRFDVEGCKALSVN